MKRNTTVFVVGALTAILALGASVRAADPPDSWLTVKTKIALMTTEGVDTSDLNVDTVSGVVTLHGKVASEPAKTKAEMVAKGIDGVKSVKNVLQVVPKTQRDTVEVKDEAIKDRLETTFKLDATLKQSGIKVSSVNQGVVLLSGDARTNGQHLRAIEEAYRVPGVRRVSSEVKVDPKATT